MIPETGRAAAQPFMNLNGVCNHLPFVFKVNHFVFKVNLPRVGFLPPATENPVNADNNYVADSTAQGGRVMADLFFQISPSISHQPKNTLQNTRGPRFLVMLCF